VSIPQTAESPTAAQPLDRHFPLFRKRETQLSFAAVDPREPESRPARVWPNWFRFSSGSAIIYITT
jgi:hypothetical protein